MLFILVVQALELFNYKDFVSTEISLIIYVGKTF